MRRLFACAEFGEHGDFPNASTLWRASLRQSWGLASAAIPSHREIPFGGMFPNQDDCIIIWAHIV
ncbi:hypothetical protein [Stieleria mannarensis]|uniref:hypothetical protein n=1 Tax=Stieleria mannarensis TaxID=2755585 RepID=UPI00160391BF|nr:hypothetical protein [Rhodopirellula sp. JC639]